MCQVTNIHDQYHTTNEHTDLKRRKYAHIYELKKFSPGIKACTPHAQTLKLIHGNALRSHNTKYTKYTILHYDTLKIYTLRICKANWFCKLLKTDSKTDIKFDN